MWVKSFLAGSTEALFRRRSIFGGSVGEVAARGASLLLTWQDRAMQRTMLATLDEFMLRDIGLSRAEAVREAAKPFWRR
jgi:uncharacterized protein YjiS (DUF1127 family)